MADPPIRREVCGFKMAGGEMPMVAASHAEALVGAERVSR